MHPAKVRRDHLDKLTDLPNIGPSMAADLRLLGIHVPMDLKGADAFVLYQRLCTLQGAQDPCVLDVFMSIIDFIEGGEPRPWWHFTETRKQRWSRPGRC